jgi:hypothetical protein
MKYRFFFFLLIVNIAAFAQSEELYPDNRPKKDGFLRVSDKQMRTELSSFTISGIVERMNSTPLTELNPIDYESTYIKFEGEGYHVTIKSSPFYQENAKLVFYDEKYLIKINGKPFYGSYGAIPKTKIDTVIVTKGSQNIVIPGTAFNDLYAPVFTYSEGGEIRTNCNVLLSNDKKRLYIYMLNNERIGRYEVTWVIADGQYVRRVVDSGIMN